MGKFGCKTTFHSAVFSNRMEFYTKRDRSAVGFISTSKLPYKISARSEDGAVWKEAFIQNRGAWVSFKEYLMQNQRSHLLFDPNEIKILENLL